MERAETLERARLERLKREVMELRYKVRRFEEIKIIFPVWRAKAHRYEAMLGALVPFALLSLIPKAQPIVAWVAGRRRPPMPAP